MSGDITITLGDDDNDVIVSLPEDDFQVYTPDDSDLTVAVEHVAVDGNLSLAAPFTTVGAYAITMNVTSATNITLPSTGTLATLAGIETLTNKTLTSPAISAPTVTGGFVQALSSLSLVNSGFQQFFNSGGVLTANRTLTLNLNNVDSTVSLNGNLTLGGQFVISGASALTLNTSGTTNATFQAGTYTLATTSNHLGAFAATTSAQLAGIISDETGSGPLVFGTSPALSAPSITGGFSQMLTSLSLANGGFHNFVASGGVLTANRTLTLTLNDANRTVSLNGNLTLAHNFSTIGGFVVDLTATGTTNVTLPTTGTLATLAGAETLTNKSLTSPAISGGTANALTALSLANSGFQHSFAFGSAITANRSLTFNTGDGNRSITFSGNLTINGTVSIAAGQYQATATNDNATAGNIGEYVEASVASAAAITLTSGTPINVASITLTPGDWDVSALTEFQTGTGTNITILLGNLSLVSATLDTTAGRLSTVTYGSSGLAMVNALDISVVVPEYRFSLNTTTTIYFVARGTFTVSTLKAWGIIRARRVR